MRVIKILPPSTAGLVPLSNYRSHCELQVKKLSHPWPGFTVSMDVGAQGNMCGYRAALTVAPSQTPTFFPSGWDQAQPMTSPELQRGSSVTESSSNLKTACQWSFKQRLQERANGLSVFRV